MDKTQEQLSSDLKEKARSKGFDPVGIAQIPGSNRLKMRTESLERWLNAGHHADMEWMKSPARLEIETLLKGAQSVLVVGLNYFTLPKKIKSNNLLIGRYAWGNDYHKVLKKRLKRLGHWLQQQRPACRWKVCVDIEPLLSLIHI